MATEPARNFIQNHGPGPTVLKAIHKFNVLTAGNDRGTLQHFKDLLFGVAMPNVVLIKSAWSRVAK